MALFFQAGAPQQPDQAPSLGPRPASQYRARACLCGLPGLSDCSPRSPVRLLPALNLPLLRDPLHISTCAPGRHEIAGRPVFL